MADGFELAERVHRTHSDTVIRLGGLLSWGAVQSPSNVTRRLTATTVLALHLVM